VYSDAAMKESPQTVLTEVGDTAISYGADGLPLVEEIRVQLKVTKGVDSGRTFVLPRTGVVVGAGADAGFRIEDPSVSRKHAELVPVPGGVHVTDMGSTNGTVFDGVRISQKVVPLGSTLNLGKAKIELVRLVDSQVLPLSRRRKFGELIGSSEAMRRAYALLERATEVDITVLLEGETGTGKELAARALHRNSVRGPMNFQIVDCGSVSPTLIEAELFGHVRGSFTGADRDRAGAFELAHQGTLFFDEIGELPLPLQPKLLRAIETREVRRIGGSARIPVDVRFVAATNRNLFEEVKKGRFREDLYYRLNVFKIILPPLREHWEDIPLLVKHFLGIVGGSPLSDEILERMMQMSWPGNVRELRNAVDRAMLLARGEKRDDGAISRRELDGETTDLSTAPADTTRPFKEVKAEIVSRFELSYLVQILDRTGGNISAAARESGIDRKHMERLIRKHHIDIKSR
jgi:two-component system nitrogen regulation response regulator GlnG